MKRDNLKLEMYPFLVRPMAPDEGVGFLVEFPDLPGCISDGPTVAGAIENGRDALKSVLLTMKEFGDPIPKPGSVGLGVRDQRNGKPG